MGANMEIAENIYKQIEGNKLKVMIGVKQFIVMDNGLIINFSAKAKNKAKKMTIIYDAGKDTYTLSFYKIQKYEAIMVSSFEDVHAGEINHVFEQETGLRTKL